MKKLIIFLSVIIGACLCAKAATMTYSNASAQNGKKPMAVLIYANWADNYKDAIKNFRASQQKLGNSYNYVELDLAKPDAKDYTDRYVINQKVPNIMLLRNNGRFSYLITRDCLATTSCIVEKMNRFIKK